MIKKYIGAFAVLISFSTISMGASLISRATAPTVVTLDFHLNNPQTVHVGTVINHKDIGYDSYVDNLIKTGKLVLTNGDVGYDVNDGIFTNNATNTLAFYECAANSTNCSEKTGKMIGSYSFYLTSDSDYNYTATPNQHTFND